MLAYLHPALAAFCLVLAFLSLRLGLRQKQKRPPAPPATLKRHLALGPWSVAAMALSAGSGLASAVFVRGWKPLSSPHGWVGLGSALAFAGVWLLGRGLLGDKRQWAGAHGLLALIALFLGGIAALLGIKLLP